MSKSSLTPFRFGANQQPRTRGLNQHTEGAQTIPFAFGIDPAGDIHHLPVGLQDQKTPGQGEIASKALSLGAGGLFHHLHQHLLAGLEQLSNAEGAFLEAQRAEIGDVNEAVFLAFADIHESGIDARQHVFNGAEIHIADLIEALGHHQFINTIIGEHRGDAQLLGDDDLLRHGRSGEGQREAGQEQRHEEALSAARLIQSG